MSSIYEIPYHCQNKKSADYSSKRNPNIVKYETKYEPYNARNTNTPVWYFINPSLRHKILFMKKLALKTYKGGMRV